MDYQTFNHLSDISLYIVNSVLYLDLFVQGSEKESINEKSLKNESSWVLLNKEERIKELIEDTIYFAKHLKNISGYLWSGLKGKKSYS